MKAVLEKIKKWQASKVATVWVADKTPREGATYKEMNYEEFAKAHNFAPIETMVPFPDTELNFIIATPKTVSIKACFNTPHNKLYIGPMDQPMGIEPAQGLGYGVYYCPSAGQPIQPGTMVSHYAGELIYDESRLYDYEFMMSPSVRINAESAGNLSRFLGHLPAPGELKYFVMPKTIRASIATANLEIQPYAYNRQGALAVVANKTIEPADVMGYSYNLEYFLNRGTLPVYYDKKGMPLDLSKVTFDKRRYVINCVFINQINYFNQLTTSGKEFKPEWISLAKEIVSAVNSFEFSDGHYFDMEKNYKQIYPKLKKAYCDHGLANAFAEVSSLSIPFSKELLDDLETMLFFDPDNSSENSKAISRVDYYFNNRFSKFPQDHPNARSHTLNLSRRKLTTPEGPLVSSNGIFANADSSEQAGPSTPSNAATGI